MKVILRESVENLGRIGDVVKVSDGYARNFLLPRNLVVKAEGANLAVIEHHKRSLEKRRLQEKSGAEELAKKLADFSCNIARKVGESDRLFGSVTASDICDKLKEAGYSVEKRAVLLDEPIKKLGVHPVSIRLQNDVTTILKVWVVKEEEA